MPELTPEQKAQIDAKIAHEKLNEYGDPQDTVYTGGTPLFNEMTGRTVDRYAYILKNHPDWAPKAE